MKQLNKWTKVAGGMALLLVLFTGCLKTEEFPPEPAIAFKSFGQFPDSASLAITFTDGDGDIGLAQDQTYAPYDTGSIYYYNFYMDYFRKEAGAWVFKGAIGNRIPVITPSGQNKALEGEIARRIESIQIPGFPQPWYGGLDDAEEGDTIRFDVRIIDRALHTSNMVSTGDIVLQ
ncbi:MAG: hypothetical protein IPG74_02305 [Flavobacteriales bacterium]|nr:hypothetical protein [Flavobacteriales bacterium]MBK7553038.1 hypothetical protein [Flavobacteriales bacterium]